MDKNDAKIFMTMHTLQNLLRVTFVKMDWYFRKYDKTKYLILFPFDEKYETAFDIIRYLIMLKSNIWDVYFDAYIEIKINSGDDLPLNIRYAQHSNTYQICF